MVMMCRCCWACHLPPLVSPSDPPAPPPPPPLIPLIHGELYQAGLVLPAMVSMLHHVYAQALRHRQPASPLMSRWLCTLLQKACIMHLVCTAVKLAACLWTVQVLVQYVKVSAKVDQCFLAADTLQYSPLGGCSKLEWLFCKFFGELGLCGGSRPAAGTRRHALWHLKVLPKY